MLGILLAKRGKKKTLFLLLSLSAALIAAGISMLM